MKQITLNIDEKKYKDFLNYINSLDYVSIADETAVSLEQQQEVNERIALYEKGEIKVRTWNEAKNDVFKR